MERQILFQHPPAMAAVLAVVLQRMLGDSNASAQSLDAKDCPRTRDNATRAQVNTPGKVVTFTGHQLRNSLAPYIQRWISATRLDPVTFLRAMWLIRNIHFDGSHFLTYDNLHAFMTTCLMMTEVEDGKKREEYWSSKFVKWSGLSAQALKQLQRSIEPVRAAMPKDSELTKECMVQHFVAVATKWDQHVNTVLNEYKVKKSSARL